MINQVHEMDALELLAKIAPASVDAIITDLPYGTTACSWDHIIPFEPMWAGVKRVLKPRGVFVTTASQPFTSALVMSNPKWFKQELIWDKVATTGYLDAGRKHLRQHENIVVFGESDASFYPQMIAGEPYVHRGRSSNFEGYRTAKTVGTHSNGERFPKSIIRQSSSTQAFIRVHPTQKPVALYDYLIRTYTQAGDLVVDFCCGSGTTAVAAATLNRRFIAGDTSAEYCASARRRLETITPDMFEMFRVAV